MEKDLLANLNEKQKEAVVFEGGPLLILAGAGSGKTRVLTHRAAWLIFQKKAQPKEIALLTFTNKAAAEMKERILSLINSSPYFAGTFHSFCARLLRIEGKNIGINKNFVIFDDLDKKTAIKKAIEELNLDKEIYKEDEIEREISKIKNDVIAKYLLQEIKEKGTYFKNLVLVFEKYEKILKKSMALDFDDLLLKTVLLFEEKEKILNKWQEKIPFILVDEWQDTNNLQYKLVKKLIQKRKNITAVGDASQSIYSFRGADYKNIENLIKDFPETTIINLERNYRSTKNILKAANFVISKNTSHPILNLWTSNGNGEKIKLFEAKNEIEEAYFVASKINSLLKTGYELKDFAVLYRTNAQSRVFEEAMLYSGIPYSIYGGVRFYERMEIKDIISYLRLLVNPKDEISQKRVEKIGKKRLEKFKEAAKEIDIKKTKTKEIIDFILEKTDYLKKFKKETEENLARIENIKELKSVAMQFEKITDFLENITLMEVMQNEKGEIKIKEKNRVSLLTLHSAKGLEFPVVFIVGWEEGIFPHQRSLFDPTQLEEERRLAYVGITRAKELLYLTYATKRLYFGQKVTNFPSRFLFDIPESILEKVNIEDILINKYEHFNE